MTLVCTRGINKVLGFGNWKKNIEGEGGRDIDDCVSGTKGGVWLRSKRAIMFCLLLELF